MFPASSPRQRKYPSVNCCFGGCKPPFRFVFASRPASCECHRSISNLSMKAVDEGRQTLRLNHLLLPFSERLGYDVYKSLLGICEVHTNRVGESHSWWLPAASSSSRPRKAARVRIFKSMWQPCSTTRQSSALGPSSVPRRRPRRVRCLLAAPTYPQTLICVHAAPSGITRSGVSFSIRCHGRPSTLV